MPENPFNHGESIQILQELAAVIVPELDGLTKDRESDLFGGSYDIEDFRMASGPGTDITLKTARGEVTIRLQVR